MISLQNLMAIDMETLKTVGIIAAAVILVFAFCIGFSKGFREVGKGGLMWALAGASFIALYHFIGKDNPLGNVLSGGFLVAVEFIWALILIVICILVTLVLGAACAAIFRPIEDKQAHMSMTIDGLEYEIEEMQVAHPVLRETTKYIPRLKKPTVFGRLFGGLLCVVNVSIILGIVAVALLVLVSTTKVGAPVAAFFEMDGTLGKALRLVRKYAFDVVTVGIVFAIMRKGFRTGFVGTTRILVARLGMLVAIVGGFALPFLDFFKSIGFMQDAVMLLAGKLTKLGPLNEIASRAIFGIGFALILCLLVAGLNALLRDLTYNIEDTTMIRFIDATLAAIIYVILGAVLCVLLWGAFFVVDFLGVCDLSVLFAEGKTFSQECYNIATALFEKVANSNLAGFIRG